MAVHLFLCANPKGGVVKLCAKCRTAAVGTAHATYCQKCWNQYQRDRFHKTLPTYRGVCARPGCGVQFLSGHSRKQFCSRECKVSARRTAEKVERLARKAALPPRHCPHCGKVVPPSMRSDARFCSDACNHAAHAAAKRPPCAICGRQVRRERKWPHPMCGVVDHIVPVANGGTNDPSNLQWVHKRCNESKGAR